MRKKPLLNAQEIPLIGIDGKRKSRKREHLNAGMPLEKKRVQRDRMPKCKCGNDSLVLPDAFGRPTDKCKACRIKAAGVVDG